MIKYQKAINIISRVSLNLSDEKISTLDSLNRVSSKNILSPTKNPLSNNTAFDGYAVSSKETKSLNVRKSKKFKIIKTLAAGDNPNIKKIPKFSAIEVMTGSIIQKPFDTIIPVEQAQVFSNNSRSKYLSLIHI